MTGSAPAANLKRTSPVNRLNAHLYLPLVQALAAGLTIQANRKLPDGSDNWVSLEADDGEVKFTCPPEGYRIADSGEWTNAITIWQINDMEWWIGAGTPESILADYMRITGCSHEDATGDEAEYPEPLSEGALDSLKYQDSDEDERPIGEPRTFREQLAIEIAAGGDFPRLFAATEW